MLLKFLKTSCLLFLTSVLAYAQNNVVTIVKKEQQWTLLVNNEPYYIRGAGGEKYLKEVVAIGGNTIRTWGLENAQTVLDEAQKLGIKVMLGMWVQHERHGFDYNDEAKIKAQLEGFRTQIKKFKNHPALLIWCVGNEYELDYSNRKVWKAVNDIAKMVKEEDKNHPVATVTAGTNTEKLTHVMNELTAIDIYGINTYGDIGNVENVLTEGNFQGPYMITEWGPNGHWESPKTMWGSSIEQTSKEKATSYKERYAQYIAKDSKQCIGSFAFLWGQKQEYTSTWYGIFSENGTATEVYDAMEYCWTNKAPKNCAPSIDSFRVDNLKPNLNSIFKSGQLVEVKAFAKDQENDKLNYSWELYPESEDLKTGGDVESKPPLISGQIRSKQAATCVLKAPKKEGRYRLFLTVSDGEKIAYCNFPFYVQPSEAAEDQPMVRFKKTTLSSFENE